MRTTGIRYTQALRHFLTVFLTAVLGLTFAATAATAAGRTARGHSDVPLRFGSQEFKPMIYVENGVVKGLQMELRNQLMAEADLPYTDRFYTQISRLYHEVELGKGNVDAWMAAELPSLVKLGIPVKPTIFLPIRLHIFGLGGTEPTVIETLEIKALITVIGYKFAGIPGRLKERLPAMRILAAPTHITAFRMLRAQRAPYVISYFTPADYVVKKLDMKNVTSTELSRHVVVLYVSRNNPDAEALVERLSKAAERILARRKNEDANENEGQREGGN